MLCLGTKMYIAATEESTIACRCRQAMKEKGLRLEDLVEETSLSELTVSGYLDGAARIPLTVLAIIAKLTGRHLDWLVAGQYPQEVNSPEEPRPAEARSQVNNQWAEIVVEEIQDGFNLLNGIITAIDDHLQDSDQKLDAKKKGELIIKLYDLFSDGDQRQIDSKTVATLIQLSS